jgi:phosphatidylglycerophosphate synthase
MTPIRRNRGLLAAPEQAALKWLAERVPSWMKPDHLSALGVAGAAFAATGFACALSSRAFLLLSVLGLVMNWLGDSLDGRLARERGIERKVGGFMLDNGLDMISYFLFAVGFAVSGLLHAVFPFILLSLYMMLSNLALARLVGRGVFDLSMGYIGTTELRVIFLILVGCLVILSNDMLTDAVVSGLSYLDLLSAFWALIMALGFLVTLRSDIRNG